MAAVASVATDAPWPLAQASESVACKICASPALPFGACDVNRGGPPGAAARPARGQSLQYHRCEQCGFMFTAQLDHWSAQEFAQHIYNAHYIEVDPDYAQARPAANAQWLIAQLGKAGDGLQLLDFGAGSGVLAQYLRQAGIAADSADPYSLQECPIAPAQQYDWVCAFEVLEHSPHPVQTLDTIRRYLKPAGRLLMSTLLQPADIAQQGCDWWYCAPRNGHISLFTASSLHIALQKTGAIRAQSLSDSLHIANF
jgi:2-polyprenyl-3-methyl-5-hydroxy-6-metoxy-1,4-benzoquinol methylase